MKISPYNFGAYLTGSPSAISGDKLKPGVIYISKPMKAVQKISRGYFIGNPQDSGIAYLKSDKKIDPEKFYCFVLVYEGEYKYTAIDGFEKKIPSMSPYKRKRPRTPCDDFSETFINFNDEI
ncbi:MAG: hypothetical protein JST80_08010 [Bdellovibrionales bacterium]|nr:hypothetical protein [Bdellovibrionales bacterium]